MRYVVYGVDAASQAPREPLVVEAESDEEARGRAVARGMAVRSVIVDQAPMPADPQASESASESASEASSEQTASTGQSPSEEVERVRRLVTLVLLPIVVVFFLAVAAVRTLWQATTWAFVWGIGVLLAGGLAALVSWASRSQVGLDVAWPGALVVALAGISALHGASGGWRWWWAKRSLHPLAQALGVPPEAAGDEEPRFLRLPVILVQGLAGTAVGAVGAWVGWVTNWSWLTVFAWIGGGALGLAIEGAVLGAILSWRRPAPLPEAALPQAKGELVSDSFAGLISGLGVGPRVSRTWTLGYALDRAVPGAVAGAVLGLIVVALSRWAVVG